jgi:hypothetical protein
VKCKCRYTCIHSVEDKITTNLGIKLAVGEQVSLLLGVLLAKAEVL